MRTLSHNTSRQRVSPIPTCWCGQVGSCASAISFSGSLPIRRCSSANVIGPIFVAMNYTRRLPTTRGASGGLGWSANKYSQINEQTVSLAGSSRMSQGNITLRHLSFCLLLSLIGVYNQSFSQRPNAEVYKILGISVEGNNPQSGTESAAIITNSGLKVGDEIAIPGDQVHQAVQKLWALRIFSDVE